MKRSLYAFLLALTTLTACDDGQIPEKQAEFLEGRVVKFNGKLTGLTNWANGYSVAIAGFDGNDEYAIISKAIPDHTDGDITIVLSNINNQVTEVQLCVLDRLRRHVLTFDKIEMQQTNDTVYMNVGERNVGMFNAIQQNYLNTTCANCHGASNRAAAGLYLTEGRSYAAMVGVPSVKIDTLKIVEPGNAEKSLLHIILHQDNVEGISMTHRDLVSEKNEQSILPLIDKWIDNGAKKD